MPKEIRHNIARFNEVGISRLSVVNITVLGKRKNSEELRKSPFYIIFQSLFTMVFSNKDKEFMNLAINEAQIALDNGDYPVGAVLVIDGKLIDKTRNSLYSGKDWVSHAESNLIRKCSPIIKDKIKLNNSKVELFTTLEPCLMCLGSDFS